MAKRILALVAAVAMVAGALAYRSSRQPDGEGGPDSGRSASGDVVCAVELGAVCDGIAGATIEPASKTAARLVKANSPADAGLGVWVAAGPWAEMVDAARVGRPPLFTKSRTLATTPIVAVVKKDRLPSSCQPTPAWKCIADAVIQDKNLLLSADPTDEGFGLFSRAAVLAGFFGRTNFGSNDLDQVADLQAELDQRIQRSRERNSVGLQRFLIQAPDVAMYLTTGADARTRTPGVSVITPTPPALIGAVATAIEGNDIQIDIDSLTAALVAAGWKAGALPPDDGLPSPGVLVALQGRLR